MSHLNWKKYMWYEYSMGSLIDMPYQNNTQTNLKLLYEFGVRQHTCEQSSFKCDNITTTPTMVRFVFKDPTLGKVAFTFWVTYPDILIIQIGRYSYNLEFGTLSFGDLLLLMLYIMNRLGDKKQSDEMFVTLAQATQSISLDRNKLWEDSCGINFQSIP